MKLTSKSWLVPALAIMASAGQALAAITFSGFTTGKFAEPQGDAGLVYTLNNPDDNIFTWGAPSSQSPSGIVNSLEFKGVDPFSGCCGGDDFEIGTITYFNGTTKLGTNADSVKLLIDMTFTDPATLLPIPLHYTLSLNTTPNTDDDPRDFLGLPTTGLTKTFTLDNGLTYKLTLSFPNNQTEFYVDEETPETVSLRATIECVPESGSSLALLGAGMLIVSGLRRKLAAKK